MKKLILIWGIVFVFILAGLFGFSYHFYQNPFYFIKGSITVDNINFNSDKDKDGLNDLDDIVEGARKEIANKTKYKDAYYNGGYPPDSEGVCTDVIWRALKNAGYDFKKLIDKDINENLKDYSIGVIKP
ncbi:MAG: DUF1287 domain-containing protein, partial [Bacillota bacterium]|nr:DUF1287 domain-containing protein [Bacillota bacterium]